MPKAVSSFIFLLIAVSALHGELGHTARAADAKPKSPPYLPIATENLPGCWVFTAKYKCTKDPVGGVGCSAGCASASFSPLLFLTVMLRLLPGEKGSRAHTMYYYLVQFPEDSKDSKKMPAGTKQPRAYGFVLDTNAVCGAVNMDLEFLKEQEEKECGEENKAP